MKTVIVGATPNPARYAYLAAERLASSDMEFVPVGIKRGRLFGQNILNIRDYPEIGDVDTVTLYVGPANLSGYEEYIIKLNPKRIIFNPGSENAHLANLASSNGIELIYGCTLVMLSAGTY